MDKKAQNQTLRFVLNSIVYYVNMIDELSEDEKENLLNVIFNIMTNSLNPDAAYEFNQAIFSLSESIREYDMEKIYDIIGWSKK